jgi:predicted aspartyl protease
VHFRSDNKQDEGFFWDNSKSSKNNVILTEPGPFSMMPRFKARSRFVLLLSTALLLLAPSVPILADELKVATTQSAASATELANQVAAAYGGMAKIKEMMEKGTRSHGKVHTWSTISAASNQFECEIISRGYKVRTEMLIFGQLHIMAYDGKKGWSQTGDWVSASSESTVQRFANELEHGLNALEHLDNPNYKLETLPDTFVDGKNLDVLKLTSPDGKWTKFFVDPITRLVMRTEFMGHDNEQGIETVQSIDYSHYKNVAGFPTPFKIVQYSLGKKSSETNLSAVTIDDSIKDALFEMPRESKISRLEHGPITIPFEYVGNQILISARVNGGAEQKFVVDTGASQTVIDKTVAQSIGPQTMSTFTVTAGSKAVPLGYLSIQKVQIGDLTMENIPALVADLASFKATLGHRPAGLIGTSVLKRFAVTIDYRDRKIVLTDPLKLQVPEGAIIVPTSPAFGSTLLVVNGTIDGQHPMNFLVDTAAGFNNLPHEMAKKLNVGAVLPVGQVFGLEGQKMSIGSVQFKSLEVGGFKLQNPVFAIQLQQAPEKPSGLFTAGKMGIIGNPIWSSARVTIDYRNDRLLIEVPASRPALDRLLAQIDQVDRLYLRTKSMDEAAAAYEKVLKEAQNSGLKAAEALAIARLANLYSDKFNEKKEAKWFDLASREYERAGKIAAESRNKQVEGEILAQWAMLYLNSPRSKNDLDGAQKLLNRALAKAPSEGSIYAGLANAMLKTGKAQMATQFVDNALLLDPSNWQALWLKYKLCEEAGKQKDVGLVLAQLERYYRDLPQVKEAMAKASGAARNQAAAKATRSAPARKK